MDVKRSENTRDYKQDWKAEKNISKKRQWQMTFILLPGKLCDTLMNKFIVKQDFSFYINQKEYGLHTTGADL